MAIILPAHIAKALGANVSDSNQVIFDVIDRVGNIEALQTQEARSYFKSLLEEPSPSSTIEVAKIATYVGEWLYREIAFDGTKCAEAVDIPQVVGSLPSTAAEHLILRAWLISNEIMDAENKIVRNSVIFEWYPYVTEETKNIIRSLCGVRTGYIFSGSKISWSESTILNLKSTSRALKHRDSDLLRRIFSEAATETTPKWRYLCLYRILEHGYLDNVFDQISKRFHTEPEQTLKWAESALRQEAKQFIELIEAAGITSFFEEILTINKKLADSGNRFAYLIKMQADRSNFKENFKRGVMVCYQFRNSIVHAGSTSIVFDRTPGSVEAVIAILPELEKAIVALLEIEAA